MNMNFTRILPGILALFLMGAFPWTTSLAGTTGDDTTARPGCARQGKGCCRGHGGGHGKGQGSGQGKQHRHRGGQGQGGCMGGGEGMEEVRDAIHSLLDHRESIQRQVEEVDGGVITITTSEDPEVTDTIRFHVMQMETRLQKGQPMRQWDPLFRELFAHSAEIKTEVEEIPGGVKVRQTSDNPEVAALIRQHATRAVSEFVRDGYDRVHQATPLPETAPPAESDGR